MGWGSSGLGPDFLAQGARFSPTACPTLHLLPLCGIGTHPLSVVQEDNNLKQISELSKHTSQQLEN